jgi:Na+-transporting NADH:ubiquinone oxidoreductase subunit C
MQHSNLYIFGFAGAVCMVCSIFVAGAAVGLKDRQDVNKEIDRQAKVLTVAGLLDKDESLEPEEIQARYSKNIRPRIIDLKSGSYNDAIDAATYDQKKALKDPAGRTEAPENGAKVKYLPNNALIYHLVEGDEIKKIIFPIEGKGLWSTMYGFIALEADANTVAGITFYEHGETPGLGGEIDNPNWKGLWPGRKVYDAAGVAKLTVIKGLAGKPDAAPHQVDGISGATLTGRGVGYTVLFWFGEQGFGPYLDNFRKGRR